MCKEWTVLIYLNGNNELEPEIWKSMVELKSLGDIEDINIVVQIARESGELVRLMRPQEGIVDDIDGWSGVRRYYVSKDEAIIIEDLDKVNMADFKTLLSFIEWGVSEYKAKRYMVILAGHGFLLASLSDLSGSEPYTMGLYEMCSAFNILKVKKEINIDILVLDICYMNNIEIVYELGKNEENTVKYLLTFRESGPLEGIEYSKLVRSINNNIDKNTKQILKEIIDEQSLELVAIEINFAKLVKVKEMLNILGELYIRGKSDKNLENNIGDIIEKEKQIKELFNEMVVHYKGTKNGDNINIIREDMYSVENRKEFLEYYNKLSITKNNYWANFVAQKAYNEDLNSDESVMEQHILTVNNIYAFVRVFNFNLNQNEIEDIIDRLYLMKGWNKK